VWGRRFPRASLVLLGGALLVGCQRSASSPSQILEYDGTLGSGQTVVEDVALGHTGNLRISLQSLRPVLVNVTSLDPSTLRLDVGLGKITNGSCVATTTQEMAPAGAVSFGLDPASYCLSFTPSATLPVGSTVAFSVEVEITD